MYERDSGIKFIGLNDKFIVRSCYSEPSYITDLNLTNEKLIRIVKVVMSMLLW